MGIDACLWGPGASWELWGLLEQRPLVAGVPVPSDPSSPRTKACPKGCELESWRAAPLPHQILRRASEEGPRTCSWELSVGS